MHRFTCIALTVGTAILASSCDRNEDAYVLPDWAAEFVDTCIVSTLDTAAWERVEGHTISFQIPPGYHPSTGVSIDTEAMDFESDDGTFGYCGSCAPWTGTADWIRCHETIDGRDCFILVGRDKGTYFIGANWPYEGGNLVVAGRSSSAEGQRQVRAAIHTVRFKREPSRELPR